MTHAHEHVEAIRTVVASVAHHIDRRQWAELRALFAPEVRTDYTSLFGGAPETQSGDALVDGWRQALAGVTTQHLLGPIVVVTGSDEAHASCHVRALHQRAGAPGGELWEVLGHYELTVGRDASGWAVTALTLHTFLQTGNRQLLEEAQATH